MSTPYKSQFCCPVCSEIPEDEIVQCEDGHTVCAQCYSNLDKCPQCNVPFDKKIRCRAMETMLDGLTFQCPYKKLGCNEEAARKEIRKHLEHCSFRPRYTPLCDLLGYKCNYKVDSSEVPTGLRHLLEEHKIIQHGQPVAHLHIECCAKDINTKVAKIMWAPVTLKLNAEDENSLVCLVIPYLIEGNFSLVTVVLMDPDKCKVDPVDVSFRIKSSSDKVEDLAWTTRPVNLKNAEVILQCQVFPMSVELLRTCYLQEGDMLQVLVGVTQDNSSKLPEFGNIEPILLSPTAERPGRRRDQVVFEGTECDECKTSPVIGVRYKCLQCVNYDLCGSCMEQKKHSHHVFAMILNLLQEKYIALAGTDNKADDWKPKVMLEGMDASDSDDSTDAGEASCDGCGFNPISKIRYTCLICTNLDFCSACVASGFHSYHIFGVVQDAAQGRLVNKLHGNGFLIIDRMDKFVYLGP